MATTELTSDAEQQEHEDRNLTEDAMEKVFGITELLERVLQFLNIQTLLPSAQRTCHRWQAVVQQLIRTNTKIRKRLFLIPATVGEMVNLMNKFQDTGFTIFVHPYDEETEQRLLNPYLQPKIVTGQDGVRYKGQELRSAVESSPRNFRGGMYLSQPPFESAEVGCCSPPFFSGLTALLWFEPEPSQVSKMALPDGGFTVGDIVRVAEITAWANTSRGLEWATTELVYDGEGHTNTEIFDKGNGGEVELEERTWYLLGNGLYGSAEALH